MQKNGRTYLIPRLGSGQHNQAAVRAIVLRAVAELEARGEHVGGDEVARLTGMRTATARRYLWGLRKKGLVAPSTRCKPPEQCRYNSVQAPEAEIAARLKVLKAVTKRLDRKPTFDELCAAFPE